MKLVGFQGLKKLKWITDEIQVLEKNGEPPLPFEVVQKDTHGLNL